MYSELQERNVPQMSKVILYGTCVVTVIYVLVGTTGYASFILDSEVDEIMGRQNILKADYGQVPIIKASLVLFCFVALIAAPYSVIPLKDSIEELVMPTDKKFNNV